MILETEEEEEDLIGKEIVVVFSIEEINLSGQPLISLILGTISANIVPELIGLKQKNVMSSVNIVIASILKRIWAKMTTLQYHLYVLY